MKRKMFSIMAIAAIALTSCKKDEVDSSELGEATLSGNVWAELDLTNATTESVAGMQVTVIVDTYDWDQNPDNNYDYEERVYTTTTDASGNWTLTIPATESGYNIDVDFVDTYGSRIVATPGGTATENVEITNGSHNNTFIYAGAVIAFNDEANVNAVNNDPSDQYGTAKISGNINVTWNTANWNVAPPANQRWNTAAGTNLGAHNVVWKYDSAPYNTSDENVYSVAIDLTTGTYELTIPTEALGTGNDVGIDWGMLDFEGSRVQNNMAGTADSTVYGIYSVGGLYYYGTEYFYDGDIQTNWDINVGFTAY
jgi:hypothetical protein